MQAQGNSQLQPSREGILFVAGFGTSLRVDRGHLIVRSGDGRAIEQSRFSRIHQPKLRRLVVFGKGGFTTWEALAWLQAVGCSFANLSRDGELVACSGGVAGGQTALRRAQALAMGTEVGLELTRLVLRKKLDGQRRICEESLDDEAASALIADAYERLADVDSPEQAMSVESQAAVAYWAAWEAEPLRFARSDQGMIPEHWKTVGSRRSALAVTSPRLATTAAQAVNNYVYALAEFACSIGLKAAGLDPGLGWLHRDAPYRASAALDIQEAVRPIADAFVLDLLRSRTFSRREFGELPSGQVRLSSSLAKPLAQAALPVLESAVQPVVGEVVRVLAASSGSRIRPRARRSQIKLGVVQPRPARRVRTGGRVASACQICGFILDDAERQICDECLPEYNAERTAKLATSGKESLAAMRASADDPARSPAATMKKREKSRSTSLAMRAWEREHGRGDPKLYESEILPTIRAMTVPQLMKLTGLSQFHCWKVRRGERRLHARHWEAVLAVGGD
jgi:CRISPR-associated protein Cas1